MALIRLQLGKNGLTDAFIINLKTLFLTNNSIRIAILKSGTRDREKAKAWVAEILEKLGLNYRANLIGYTIVLRKIRKNRDE